jgi:hypothetical protein
MCPDTSWEPLWIISLKKVTEFYHVNIIIYKSRKRRNQEVSGRASWWPWNWTFPASSTPRKCYMDSVHNDRTNINSELWNLWLAGRESDWMEESKSTKINMITIVYFISDVPHSPNTLFSDTLYFNITLSKERLIVYCVLSYQVGLG